MLIVKLESPLIDFNEEICNIPNESHQNERDPKVVQVWECTVKDDLKELIGTTYTNKMHLLSVAHLLRTPELNVLNLEQLWDGCVGSSGLGIIKKGGVQLIINVS